MSRARKVCFVLIAAALGVVQPACLPTDTRTPPGSLYTTVTASDMTLHGIPETADGWSITFQRVLVGIGHVNLGEHESSCNRYSNRGYMRLLDLQVAGAQKLSQAYALGQCSVSFRVSYPGGDSVLGASVTAGDRIFMDTPQPDGYEDPAYAGTAVYVEGTARRGSSVKHFAWAFRRRIAFTSCGNDATDAGPRGFSFQSHDAFQANVAVHAEALFQDSTDPASAKLHFQPYADADTLKGNDDGNITLDELGKVSLAEAGVGGTLGAGAADGGPEAAPPDAARVDALGDAAGNATVATLEDYVYLDLVPQMFRYQDIAGSCTPTAVKNFD